MRGHFASPGKASPGKASPGKASQARQAQASPDSPVMPSPGKARFIMSSLSFLFKRAKGHKEILYNQRNSSIHITLAKTELLYPKNVGA